MIKAELLAPAGSPEALDAAIAEGADAVYLGLKDFNARMRSANFSYAQFEAALRSLHRMGRKLYVTVNTVFEQREADRVYQLLKYLAGLGPDGILVQDFGVITMARENFPSLKLHASTQMNVASARGLNLLSRHGFSRVVLARELSLAEIREIRANTNMELEVFVHGALCLSVSGLCLFSSYLGGKSANRGMCTQACRRFYTAHRGKGLGEAAGEGGFYFSPSDLELIAEIPALADAGVNAFKIEGRMKSAEYVGAVVSAYRLVIDNLERGEEQLQRAIAEARSILKNDFARSKTAYFINASDTGSAGIDWLNPQQSGGTGISLGTLLKTKGRGEEKRGLVSAGAIRPSVGDSIRLHRADDTERLSHKISSVEAGPKGAQNSQGSFWISIPASFAPGDSVYLTQTKALKRYAKLIRRESSSRGPGRDRAPLPPVLAGGPKAREEKPQTGPGKKSVGKKAGGRAGQAELPGGLYVQVSRIEDLYVIQSKRPVRAILPYSRKTARQILAGGNLPFPPREIILSLDPFFPQALEGELAEKIPALMEMGYTQFMANNLGHFSLLRAKDERKKAVIIAGPWLYTFNAWAWDFISRCGAAYGVTPLENSRQNVEKTFPLENNSAHLRSRVFITIFARPSVFRIRQDLCAHYDFENFSGNRDEAFFLAPSAEGSLVYPLSPFSIVDKIPFLREAGFSRFILDFSDHPLKKAEYKDIMEAANRFSPISGSSRFNWKNGFYKPPS